MNPVSPSHRPATSTIVLVLGVVYLAYGFNFFAVKVGVKSLPPLLFAGSHITLAGLILFGYLAVSGRLQRLPARNLLWAAVGGSIIFVGGTGLLSLAERPGPESVDSGVAAVLRSTTPLCVIAIEWLRPRGEPLSRRMCAGLVVAVAGVVVLLSHKLEAGDFFKDTGVLLVLGSAFAWAVGTLVLRHRRPSSSAVVGAAHQMLLGGFCMLVVGMLLGEMDQFAAHQLTTPAVLAFLYLLIFHSLVAFVSINWLLGHVSPALVTTYDYVTPVMAVLAGWLLLDEPLAFNSVAGMVLILAGVGVALSATGEADRKSRQGGTGKWESGKRAPE